MISDPRKVVGAKVNALASSVTHISECKRLFGAIAKYKRVNGIVKKVLTAQPTSGRASTSLDAELVLLEPNRRLITKTLKLNRIKLGHLQINAPNASESLSSNINGPCEDGQYPQTKEVTVHDAHWEIEEVSSSIGGSLEVRRWFSKMHDGGEVNEGQGLSNYSLLDCFLSMFPSNH